MKKQLRTAFRATVIAGVLLNVTGTALADHSWGGYHWARAVNPFTLKLGDNLSLVWDSYLGSVSNDWSASSVLNTTVVSGLSNPRTCKPVSGRVEVCDSKYGNNGWLGIASVWVDGDHITQGTVKMNNTYFQTAKYNTPAWRNLVLCQEVGHTFGLDHQDENFTNLPLGTCMDYTNDPTPNQHPNAHDYEELEILYTHLDSLTTVTQTTATTQNTTTREIGDSPSDWGRAIRTSGDGKNSVYERVTSKDKKVYTFVVWAK
jgi:hypothetical protein